MTSSNAKIVSRVQALLAKAESTTFPEEAEALTAKAQELITRYSIDEAIAQQRRAGGAVPELRRMRIDAPYVSAKTSLLSAIGNANYVQVVSVGAGVVTLVGFAGDLEVVELLFASLLVQSTTAMLRVPRAEMDGQPRAFRHAFLIAFARRVGQRLSAARTAAHAEAEADIGVGLVPLFDARQAAVAARVNDEFPRLRTKYQSISHGGGFRAGRAAAECADIGERALAR